MYRWNSGTRILVSFPIFKKSRNFRFSVDSDDLLDKGTTDANGDFHLSGWTKEYTPIDVQLNIYHDCMDGIKPCQRKFGIKIPDAYTTSGKIPKKTYDAGVIQLAGGFPGESRDCIH